MKRIVKIQLVAPAALAAFALAAGAAGPASATEAACTAAAATVMPASVSILPTKGAKVTKADYVAAKGATGPYCKVIGEINAVDPMAHPVLFEVNLPEAWNGKALQYGGGGLNGTLVNGLQPLRDQPPGVPIPIAQGYATYGTDAGHPNAKPDIQVFWNNPEEAINHAYASYKKTHDVAMTLISAYYGKVPTRSYFFGGSEGGREAMNSIQRYPADYDGVVATVPAIHWVSGKLANNRDFRESTEGGFMNAAKLKLLRAKTNAVCDQLDGLQDGVISRYQGCSALFKPETLRCAGGADTGDTCLSDKQIVLVNHIRSPYGLPYPLKYGYTQFNALATGGEDMDGTVNPWLLDDEQLPADDLGRTHYGPGTVRFLLVKDANYHGVPDLMQYKDVIQKASDLMDATNPDLSAYQAHGGKLIMKQNGADYTVGGDGVIQYYDNVVKTMGAAKVNTFIRYYVNPGVNHGGSGIQADGSEVPDRVDLIGALDKWVETNQAPGTLTVASYAKGDATTPLAVRPLCTYPNYPQYVSGDPKAASSFTCKSLH